MKKIFFNLILFVLLISQGYAQPQPQDIAFQNNPAFSSAAFSTDFPFGVHSFADLGMTSYKADPSAPALMLKEYGKAFFISNTTNPPIQFEYHTMIKIFDTTGFKHGTVEIPLYSLDRGSFERVREVKGKTSYKDETGKTISANLAENQVKTIKIDDHHSVVRFTLPLLRKGCVIEYAYILESPYIVNFKTWDFQSDIPKLSSIYNAIIPRFFGYEVSLKGPLKLVASRSQEIKKCYYYNGLTTDCMSVIYGMENIPALIAAPNIISLKSQRAALYFQLTDMVAMPNFAYRSYGVTVSIGKDWNKFDKYLMMHDQLGEQLKAKSPFKNTISTIVAGKTTDSDKAKAIYQYIQKNFKWNGYYSILSDYGLKGTFEKHSGNVADINLLLISALNAAGIKTDAVILSSRENGIINMEEPSLNDFNYLVAKATIDGTVYLIDATETDIAFGELPLRAINDKGRALRVNGDSNWVMMQAK